MSRGRIFGIAALAIFAALALGSCMILESVLGLGNKAPTVTLSSSDDSAYSDQTVTFTANASDPDDDELTYAWYWNGTVQPSATGSSVNWYWLRSSSSTETVKVVVSDGNGESDESSVAITIYAGSSLRIDNLDTVSYDEFYTSSSYSSWGADLYSGTLAPNNRLTIYNLGTGYLYYKAVDVNNYFWDTYTNNGTGYSTNNGYYRTWSLYASSCPVSAVSNSIASVADIAGSAAAITTEARQALDSAEAEATKAIAALPIFRVTPIPLSERPLDRQDGAALFAVSY